MKTKDIFSYLPAALLFAGCAPGAMLSNGALTDDLYYDSRQQLVVAPPPQQAVTPQQAEATPQDRKSVV